MAARAIIHLILQLLLVASSFVLVANNNWDDNEARSSSIAIITANAQFTSAEYTYDDYLDQSFDGLTEEQKLERQLLLLSEELACDWLGVWGGEWLCRGGGRWASLLNGRSR